MNKFVLNSTDDNVVQGQLDIYVDGVLDVSGIPVDSTIVIFVQDISATIKIIDDIPILSTDPGNDWANRKIRGILPKASSAELALYDKTSVLVCVRATVYGQTETFTAAVPAQKLL